MLLSTAEGSSPGKKGHEYPTTSQSARRSGTVVAPNDRNPALLASCWLHSLLSSRQTLLEFAQTPPHSPPGPGCLPTGTRGLPLFALRDWSARKSDVASTGLAQPRILFRPPRKRPRLEAWQTAYPTDTPQLPTAARSKHPTSTTLQRTRRYTSRAPDTP